MYEYKIELKKKRILLRVTGYGKMDSNIYDKGNFVVPYHEAHGQYTGRRTAI